MGEKRKWRGRVFQPMQLAIDSKDNVYVVDRINNRVQKFDNEGNFITKWGTNHGAGNLDPRKLERGSRRSFCQWELKSI